MAQITRDTFFFLAVMIEKHQMHVQAAAWFWIIEVL